MHEEKITFVDLITIYWPQLVLILGFIGFVIKSILNYKLRKSEINHHFFLNRRFEVISEFLKMYSKSEMFLRVISASRIKDVPFSEKWDIISKNQIDLDHTFILTRIYLTEEEAALFFNLKDSISKINLKVFARYFKDDIPISKELLEEYNKYCIEEFNKNSETIKDISKLFRKKYKG